MSLPAAGHLKMRFFDASKLQNGLSRVKHVCVELRGRYGPNRGRKRQFESDFWSPLIYSTSPGRSKVE